MKADRINGIAATDIAIIGMAAHLPGAGDVEAFWANLRAGVESIRPLSEEELLAAGESPARMRRPNYVPAAAPLEGFANFDADFFGFSPKEAAILDPQHRHFLEVAWEALENAGHVPEHFPGAIGVWGGCGMGTYFWSNICSNRDLVEQTGMFLLRHTGNDKDFLTTRVSHVLNLTGPSVNVQTACSTSLVAVHHAIQALLSGECDMALAGGVTIELPQHRGYLFEEGEILSPDGHCHAFDHRAQGTVFGSGAGCVVLRRAVDAIRDGDHIWAIVKGTAINNDGASKAGYLAPSVDGQAACIAEAQMIAGVSSDSVSYIECHGTGTYLGDPIEVAALTEAFRESGSGTGHCRIGSVKTNIGHLDTAAGVASLIKVALSLHHRELPPSLGYEAPNPAIDFETSPFRVNHRLTPWQGAEPLRAGVNSLGVGGTNAHAVLEEAPVRAGSEESLWPFQPIVISGRNKAALDAQALRLAAHLRARPDQPLADVAFTLKQGRRAFEKRRVLVAESHEEAARLLEGADPRRIFNHEALGDNPEVIFMFPGGGAQHAGMARDLYETEPVFADWMDRGLAHLQPRHAHDLRALWLPEPGAEAAANAALKQPSVQLPLIMITEFALAKLFESWGVTPAALVGHSMGENTAAALAGVMGFEACIDLVHLRGRLFDTVPAGGMLSVPLPEAELRPMLGADLDMASVNAPGLCVVSGPDAALDALAHLLAAREVETTRIAIDIAAHSRMLEPILKEFGDHLRGMKLSSPQIPIISNSTGRVLTEAEATSPDYWVAHLRGTVDFQACMATLAAVPGRIFLEMGPGRALSSLAGANGIAQGQIIPAMRHPEQKIGDDAWLIATIARLSACGHPVSWAPIWGGAARQRVPLPSYAFQKKTWFIAPGQAESAEREEDLTRIEDLAAWGWKPHWRPAEAGFDIADLAEVPPATWLLFEDGAGVLAHARARLLAAGHRVVSVTPGDGFARLGEDRYALAPERGREGLDLLIRDLVARGLTPSHILHGWLLTRDESHRPGSSFLNRNLEQGFWSLLFLLQALAAEDVPVPLRLVALTNGAAALEDEALPWPEKALILGPVRVAPREFPGLSIAALDLELPLAGRRAAQVDVAQLSALALEEALGTGTGPALIRGARRRAADLRAVKLPETSVEMPRGAHVLITGGFGGIGLTLAEDLIRRHGVKITLIARSKLPPRDLWRAWLAKHDPADPVSRRILALQRLEGLGGEVLVTRADVANPVEMTAARDAGVARFGPVHAVIHAAGVVADGPLLARASAEVEAVLAPKLHGTRVLDALFPDGSIALLVLFSSTSTQTGPAGQVDYVAANEYLNAFARSRAGGRTKVLALNWGIWQGVGMAAESLADRLGAPEAPRQPIAGPMLADAGFDRRGNRVFHAEWGHEAWFLDGHRTKAGTALIPGTGYLELAAEAWKAQGEEGAFILRDLTFLRALDVAEGERRSVRVRLTRSDEGYAFEVQSEVSVSARRGWLTHATGQLSPLREAAPRIDPLAIAARLPVPETGEGLESPQEAHLAFGPRWRVLNSRTTGKAEGLARLRLPAAFAHEPASGWLLHPALMDLATGWAMDLIEGYRPDHLWVPVSYAAMKVWGPLPAEVVSHIRSAGNNSATRSTASFDVTLATPSGEVLVQIAGFTIHRLEGGLSFPPPEARMLESDQDAAKPLSPAEERLVAAFRQGIRPEEGAEAFRRALSLPLSQVVVSSLDLPALVRQTTRAAEAARPAEGQSFERPDLDSEYVAPRNEIEARLVTFWQELLGVGQVGVEDSFFDLGGHSLIAVRLFAMVKKAFRVDFPISVLFEAPTIAACARLIAAETGVDPDAAPAAAGAAPAPRPARRFTHLVPMHRGEGGDRRPFFLVAGMFGNVLNLRHLAGLIGTDRPFYGLQARGLHGGEAPHDSFEDAARDYILEMRQVQPKGPWLLGGFSGGGLIAWEIARQLEAAGEEVPLLVLLDTPLPMRPALSRLDKGMIKLAELRRKGPAYLAEWAKNRLEWERRKRGPAAEATAEGNFHNREIEAAFRAALPRYQMEPRLGTTALFRPPLDLHWQVSGGKWVSGAKEYVFPDNDLTRFAPVLQVLEVPGDHDSMVLEPNVRVLASGLRGLIETAEGDASRVLPLISAAE